MSDTLTITLTNRAPVRINKDLWPVVASARESPGDFVNGTPVSSEQVDTHRLVVRQHFLDGRTLVYGVLDAATAWTHTESRRGGEYFTVEGADPSRCGDKDVIVAAIRRVCRDVGLLESVARDCIADLPADDLDE